MNALTNRPNGQMSTRFASIPVENDLGAGIQGGFGHIGYKGKVWSTRYRGQENKLMRADGDGAVNSIEVVIVKASAHVSKIFYEHGYVEGSNAAPDCFSTTGLAPDPGATKKQATTCAACPKNVWGARITPEGKKAKACSDSKRLAVVPSQDIDNEALGGPMLLRIPAASLQDLAAYGDKMQKVGYHYFAVVTRIAFDNDSPYPKFLFNAVRELTDDEADKVIALQKDPRVERILAENEFEAAPPAAAQAQVAAAFEQPPAAAAPVQPVTPVVTPQPAPAPAPAPQAAGGFGAVPAPVAPAPAQAEQAEPPPQANGSGGASAFEQSIDEKLKGLI